MRIAIRLQLLAPWRVSSGEGGGAFVDSLVRKDPAGLPFVPGSTLRGLTRDALRILTQLLGIETCAGSLEQRDGGAGTLCGIRPRRQGSGLPCPLCALIGSPFIEPEVAWQPARLDRGAEPKGTAPERDVAPERLIRVRPRTSIDDQRGRAADERLFSQEEAAASFCLRSEIELGRGLARREIALLVGALRFVRELGGGRRRGLGACRIQIEEAALEPAFASWQDAVRYLGNVTGEETPGEPPGGEEPEREAQRVPAVSLGSSSGGTTRLRIDAKVVGEVVLGGRPESGHLVTGNPYVPGSTVRGALATRWRDAHGEDFARCFLGDSVRFGFLYPLIAGEAAAPLPLSMYTCKLHPGPCGHGDGHGVVDLLANPLAERCEQPACRGRLVPWGPRFGAGDEAQPVELWLSPHNRIDAATQTVGSGALFAYQALAHDTRLAGTLSGPSSALERLLAGARLQLDEPFRLRVGRRKNTLGFLDCVISEMTEAPNLDGGEGEVEGVDLRLDLLTPTIVRDAHLRFRTALLPVDVGLDRPSFDGAFAGNEVIAGWQTAHRLPKAEQLAIRAGSSYLLRAVTRSELTKLHQAKLAGIGERRAEGFGALSWRRLATAEVRP